MLQSNSHHSEYPNCSFAMALSILRRRVYKRVLKDLHSWSNWALVRQQIFNTDWRSHSCYSNSQQICWQGCQHYELSITCRLCFCSRCRLSNYTKIISIEALPWSLRRWWQPKTLLCEQLRRLICDVRLVLLWHKAWTCDRKRHMDLKRWLVNGDVSYVLLLERPR